MTGAAVAADKAGTAGCVGLVGLGLVGTALGGRLRRAGYHVLGHDHSAAACVAWAAAAAAAEEGPQTSGGCCEVASLQDIAQRCSAVVLAVFDTAGVLQVTEGAGGLISGGKPQVLVDCSTGDPDALQALAGRLAAHSIAFIEAPLSGSSQQIADGTATLLLGATTAALQRHAALLNALAPQQVHVGGAGMGARAKLATNLVLGLNRAALAEGLVFAETQGISASAFLALVLATPARSEAALVKGGQMVRGDFSNPQSRIRQHLKDLQIIQASARGAGQRLPFTDTHATLLQAAVLAGDGDLDNAAIIRQLRRARL